MAAVRGRKRTEDTTPNRARDIQRAFRARRAAHLEALEDRIHELEEENNIFRALLSYPPANRPQLGKGPTGRGLAKSRSRITIDSFHKSHESPTPPSSEAPTTPPMECPIPLPPTGVDSYCQGELNTPTGPMHGHDMNPAFIFPQEKLLDPSQAGLEHYGFDPMSRSSSIDLSMGALPSEFEAVSLDPATIPPGMFSEVAAAWNPVQPSPPMPIQSPHSMQANPMNSRAFSFTQQPAAIAVAPRTMPAHMRPTQGHRRANTEPQSLGSLIAEFNPGHRPSSSEIVAASGTPSPPPLPIRAPYQGTVYQ